MYKSLLTFASMLILGTMSTATVTIANTPPSLPEMYLAQRVNCNNAQTQSEINQCAQLSYQNADKKLNQFYQKLLPKLPKPRQQKLITAQQAWINFRDTNCEFERSGYEGGSIAPAIYFSCLETMTNQRTKQLKEYIQPVR
ncbi:lysozyme inhibitor LprI family protein [Calothrix sp. PCC 7507]|uniref:lysozyme inhibitor LprI family protein n=1 Tax=Calothrix sp. PCC 7507 TaxID=99598 RepID=UPI00029F3DE3|nr:lysozyme inhibitor LprI family protein [Calothrix sp. PCC 7507]AFY34674.1 protein of unknown function DUF1311 [Calothrix sp. PCC 7507]